MFKTELIEEIAKRTGFSKKWTSDFLDALINVMSDAFAHGQDVIYTGFGSFNLVEMKERQHYDMRKQEIIMLPKSVVLKFTPGKYFKEGVKKWNDRLDNPKEDMEIPPIIRDGDEYE